MRLIQPQAFRYDRQKTEVMRRVLTADSNCIDVGAYRGEVLKEMLRFAPRGRHFAFEPLPENHAFLLRRFEGVTVLDVALTDFTGTSTFQFIRSRPARSGLRRVEYPEEEEIRELTVRTGTLDLLIPSELPIRLLKVDVEGGEHAVLRGGRGLIRRHRPVILFEHDQARSRSLGASSEAIYDLLTGLDLQVSLMDRWLRSRPGLTREEFLASKQDFEYIAYSAELAP